MPVLDTRVKWDDFEPVNDEQKGGKIDWSEFEETAPRRPELPDPFQGRQVSPQELASIRETEALESEAPIGGGLARMGRVLKGGLADIGTLETGLPNVRAAIEKPLRAPLPIESTMENIKSPATSFPYKVAGGLIETAPQLAAVMAAGPEAAVPAAAAVFGSTPEGFNPKQAAIAAALPYVGKYAGEAAGVIPKVLGTKSLPAINAFKAAGGLGGAAGYLGVINESEIQNLPPEQRAQARKDALAGIVGQTLLGPIGVKFEKAPIKAAQLEVITEAAPLLPKAAEATKQALAAETPKTTEVADASKVEKAATVHGDVRPLEKPAEILPVEEGGKGVQPQTGGGLPEGPKSDVLLDAAARLEQLKKLTNPTPEEIAERDALQAKSDSVKDKMKAEFDALKKKAEPGLATAVPEALKPVEPKAAETVTQNQVTRVAKTEGERSAKDIKNELVAKIEDSISKAIPESELPKEVLDAMEELKSSNDRISSNARTFLNSRKENKVTIEIPGDGTFTIWNTKEALGELLVRAKRLSTSSGEPAMTVTRGMSTEDKLWVQKQVAEAKAKESPSEATYIIQELKGVKSWKPVAGVKVALPGIKGDFFVHQSDKANWSVTEQSTGKRVGGGETKKKAVENASKELTKLGQEKFDKLVQAELSNPDRPPRPDKAQAATPKKYRIGTSPQTYTLLERLAQSDVEKSAGEQPVRVRNDKTGKEEVVLEQNLTEVQARTAEEKAAASAKTSLDDQLRAAGMEPSVFKNAAQKQAALKRAKAKGKIPLGPGAATRPGAEATDIGGAEFNIPPLETLADAVSKFPKQKASFKERWQQWLDQNIPKDNPFARALATTKAFMARLIAKATTLPEVTDLQRRVGRWDVEDQEASLAAYKFSQAVRKQFPNRAKLRALSNWINAGGDRAKLEDWASKTKDPKLRKTYEDAVAFGKDEQVLADSVRHYHDQMLNWAQREGVLEEGVEDYIHRFYPREGDPRSDKLTAALRYLKFTKDFPGFKKRFYESDFDAEQAGKRPEKDAAIRILAYDQGFRRALTARAFVKDSFEGMASPEKLPDGTTITRPELDVIGNGVKLGAPEEGKTTYLVKPKSRPDSGDPADYRGDYVTFDHPAFRKWKYVASDEAGNPILLQGDIVVHPEFARKYSALFERSWWSKTPARRAVLGVSSGVKQTMLSLSGFHPVQIGIHALEHKVNPFKLADLNLHDPAQRELVEGGLAVADTKGMQYFSEGVAGVGILGKAPLAGEFLQRANNWLFKDYIPRIKMTMALAALDRNLGEKSYTGITSKVAKDYQAGKLTREQVVRLTARQANAAFGEQNYRAMFRHPSFQDTLRALFLAPDFGEARLKFPLQALHKYGGEQRAALILGAVGMMVVAKSIEKMLTDEVHWNKPFTVTYNNREYGLRNVASDLYHLASDASGYIRNRLNPIYTRPLMEFVTGRDAFGRKRNLGAQMVDQLKTIVPISVRGGIEKDQRIWESFMNAFGITERRATAFGTVMKDVNQWKDSKGYTAAGEFVYDADKDPYHALTQELTFGSDERVLRELNRLAQGKTEEERAKIFQHYRRSLYENRYLTGSKAHEAEYRQQLSGEHAKEYNDALKERRQMWDKFLRVWTKAVR